MLIFESSNSWKETCLFITHNVKSVDEIKKDILSGNCFINRAILSPFTDFSLEKIVEHCFDNVHSVIYSNGHIFYRQKGEFHTSQIISAFEEYYLS